MLQKMKSFFKFSERGTNFRKEIIGGTVTFLAMSYILAVNPTMISDAGIPIGGAFIATALGAVIATLIMGLIANYPIALAPGMGINAFFTYTIVLTIGYTWQEALAASFIGGVIFVGITFTSLRTKLIEAIPASLRSAIGAGIGFFIAFVGLQNAGIIVGGPTLVQLGNLLDPSVLVALFGIVVIIVLYSVKGKLNRFSFILAILSTAVLYLILSLFGVFPSVPILNYSDLGSFKETLGAFGKGLTTLFQDTPGGISSATKLMSLPIVIFALVFVDIFDTAGTLVAVSKPAGLVDEDGNVENLDKAMFADAVGTLVSSTLGTPEITSFVESSTGIESGARTGFSNIVVAFLFLVAIALYPVMGVFHIFPVTSMALVLVGVLMAGQIKDIDWDDKALALSSFFTIIMMVLTYSIADGIAFGFITYTIAKLSQGKYKEVHPLIYIFSLGFIIYFIFYSQGFNLFG